MIADGASVILGFGGEGSDSLGGFDASLPAFAAMSSATPALAPAGISTVPEPDTWALLVAGCFMGFAAWRRRKRA